MCKFCSLAHTEEETTRLNGCAGQWCTDSSVEAFHAILGPGLAEAVKRSRVDGGLATGLRLKSDFDSVERILDDFSCHSSNLYSWLVWHPSRLNLLLTEPNAISCAACFVCVLTAGVSCVTSFKVFFLASSLTSIESCAAGTVVYTSITVREFQTQSTCLAP